MNLTGKKSKIFIPIFLTLISTYSFSSQLKTDIQKESYSIGASTGNYISNQIYGQIKLGAKVDIDLIVEGFQDALKEKLKLSEKDIITQLNNRAEKLNKSQKAKFKKIQTDNLKKEQDFLAKNAKEKGVVTTKSGLQYKVIKQGKGKKPKAESIVIINYKASLLDGYVFDDTYARKSPAHLSMVNVVDGLKEGLMLMNEGSKVKLFIPSKLGYGSVQMRDIPPNSVLVFEIELSKVLKPGEMKEKPKFMMMGQDSKKEKSPKSSSH